MDDFALMDILESLCSVKKIKWDRSGSCGLVSFNDGSKDVILKISKENAGSGSAGFADFRVRVVTG